MSKVGLCYMGGGSGGISELAGTIQAFEEGVVPDIIVGASAGGFNAALLGFGTVWEAKDLWLESADDMFEKNWNLAESWWQLDPALKRLEKFLSGRKPHCDVHVAVSDLWTETLLFATPDNPLPGLTFAESVVASGSIPCAMNGRGEGGRYQDGGVLSNLPLKKLIDLGADDIHIFLTVPFPLQDGTSPKPLAWPRIATSGIAAVQAMIHKSLRDDMKLCMSRNGTPGYKNISITVRSPITDFREAITDMSLKSLQDIFAVPIKKTVLTQAAMVRVPIEAAAGI